MGMIKDRSTTSDGACDAAAVQQLADLSHLTVCRLQLGQHLCKTVERRLQLWRSNHHFQTEASHSRSGERTVR